MKKIERVNCSCKHCNKEFEKRITSLKKFCSVECKKTFQKGKSLKELHGDSKANEIIMKLSIASQGENNPNFRK